MKFTPREVSAAVMKATDWLEANPTKHIVGELAVRVDGTDCDPNSPEADCFCMLGRISKELDVEGYPGMTNLRQVGLDQATIYGINDGRPLEEKADCPQHFRSNGKVLEFVRNTLEKVA